MASNKGSRWSDSETECLIEIWSETFIQEMLDRTHRNSVVFKKISLCLAERGYSRSVEQCRDKLRKLRTQYLQVRSIVNKSGSSAEEKDRFPWYDAVDSILGTKPTTQPKLLESSRVAFECPEQSDIEAETSNSPQEQRAVTPLTMPEPAATRTLPVTPSTPESAQTTPDGDIPSTSSAPVDSRLLRPGPERTRPSLGRKRKRDQEHGLQAFMEKQTRMFADFMQEEDRRHADLMQAEERRRHDEAHRADVQLERLMQHQTNLMKMLLSSGTVSAPPAPPSASLLPGGASGQCE